MWKHLYNFLRTKPIISVFGHGFALLICHRRSKQVTNQKVKGDLLKWNYVSQTSCERQRKAGKRQRRENSNSFFYDLHSEGEVSLHVPGLFWFSLPCFSIPGTYLFQHRLFC